VEKQLAAGLGEGQVTEFIDDHEVDAVELVAETAGAACRELGVETVHKVDGAEEADAPAVVDGVHTDGDRQMRFSRTSSANEYGVAGLVHEIAIMEAARQGFVDRGGVEVELSEMLHHRELGCAHLVAHRARGFFGELGFRKIAKDLCWRALVLDPGAHGLVIGGAHAGELQRAHHIEDFMPFHGAPPQSGDKRMRRDNQDATSATIRMRERRRWRTEGRA
jgi:hypothetical protein